VPVPFWQGLFGLGDFALSGLTRVCMRSIQRSACNSSLLHWIGAFQALKLFGGSLSPSSRTLTF
jgi:hypothetical protein